MWILLACASTPKIAAPAPELPEAADPTDPAAFEPTFHPATTVTGTVVLSHDEGAKSRPVTLDVDEGEDLLLAYEPTAEWTALEGRRVELRGRPWRPSPYAAGIDMLHFEVEELDILE